MAEAPLTNPGLRKISSLERQIIPVEICAGGKEKKLSVPGRGLHEKGRAVSQGEKISTASFYLIVPVKGGRFKTASSCMGKKLECLPAVIDLSDFRRLQDLCLLDGPDSPGKKDKRLYASGTTLSPRKMKTALADSKAEATLNASG